MRSYTGGYHPEQTCPHGLRQLNAQTSLLSYKL